MAVRSRLIAYIVFALMAGVVWACYAQAFGAAFLLDDLSNLGDLGSVDDAFSALQFVFSGTAGPLGRPLSLASFLPQAAAWEAGAAPFLKVNVAIHLVNAFLLACLFHRLSLVRGVENRKALFIAVSGSLLWAFMPLLASASLMVVQRMTTLSATFMLLGLLGYLYARSSLERDTNKSLSGMSIALIAGTVLAVLAKESGALLPTYVLVLEATLLERPTIKRMHVWRAWFGIFLVLPTVAICVYLALLIPYSEELVLRRDFGAGERLMTESRILWEYVFNAFFPRPGQFGPFHDYYPIARNLLEPLTLLAVAGWIAVFALSLLWRRKFPLFAFAILWFLGGHLLESTTVALELYFEHRNYVPIAGFVFALVSLLTHVPDEYRKTFYASISMYILVSAYFLVSLTTLWGNPDVAAAYWHDGSPGSVRAATTYATRQLAQNGPKRAILVLNETAAALPQAAYIRIQALNLACLTEPAVDHRKDVEKLEDLLSDVSFTYTAGTMLSQLHTTLSQVDCRGADVESVKRLADSLANNPRYRQDSGYRQLHHQLMASIHRHKREFSQAISHLGHAISYNHTRKLNMMMVTALAEAERFDAARSFIQDAHLKAPLHPVRRYLWQRDLNELETYIRQLEQSGSGT